MFKIVVKSENQKNRDSIVTLLIEFYFILSLMQFYIAGNVELQWYTALVAAVLSISLELEYYPIVKTEIIFYISIVFLHTLSVLYNHNLGLSSPIQYMRYIFIAMALVRVTLDQKITRLVLLGYVLFYFICILSGTNVYLVLNGVSSNGVSAHLLVFCILYFLSLNGEYDYCSILIVLAIGVICIWSGSRGGMFSVAALLFGIMYRNNSTKHKKIIKFLKTGILVVLAILILYGLKDSSLFQVLNLKTSVDGTSGKFNLLKDVRFLAIKDYFTTIKNNFGDFLFGAPLTSVATIKLLGVNPHNSFIYLHSNFGIIGWIIVMLRLITSGASFFRKKTFVSSFCLQYVFVLFLTLLLL